MNPRRAEEHIRRLVESGLRIAVVVPCYNTQEYLATVVQGIPDYINDIVLVDDASSDGTGSVVDQLQSSNERVSAVHLESNRGVGGATLAGFAEACKLGADVIAKMDGDDQMDPQYLPLLIEPLVLGQADYVKGNRFWSVASLAQMPIARRVGNAGLSFLTRMASGYWNMFDPTNGYIGTRPEVIDMLPLRLVHRRYFFESSMLIALGIAGAVVMDIPIHARYGTEESHLKIRRALFEFPIRLTIGLMRRIWYRKIFYSLTMEAILGFFGLILLLAGVVFGAIEFVNYSIIRNVPAPTGTVMTSALAILLGFQMIVNAIVLDIQSVPSIPLCGRYEPAPDLPGESE